MIDVVLFITHKKTQCGVYDFGLSIVNVLKQSSKFNFIHAECDSFTELQAAIELNKPTAIVYNYIPKVMPWAASKIAPRLLKNNLTDIYIPQIGIMHEFTQTVSDKATNYKNKYLPGFSSRLTNSIFDFYIAPDPTLLLKNPFVYKTGRLIPVYENKFKVSNELTIGSFGFATNNKGFEDIIELVQNEFDEATIRLNISSADFGDKEGIQAKLIADNCKSLVKKPGIQLKITHDFLDKNTLLDFLAQNTCNVFLYKDKQNRGISSTIENAMAVKIPIAVSDSIMFRHVLDTTPSICVSSTNLKTIISNGFKPLQKHYDEWNEANLLWEYERILTSVLFRVKNTSKPKIGIGRRVLSFYYRLLSMPDKSFTWLRNSNKITEDDMSIDKSIKYQAVSLPEGNTLNRILDNNARELYKSAISKLFQVVPKTMAKKIPEANVQQAFVLDTVYRYLSDYKNPKLLCVGSYEDTASMTLIRMGHNVEEIDPMLNYYLQEYYTKPNIQKDTYDIVFSTSVIEHDPDDESFVNCIDGLLAPGGVCVITCDFKDGWKLGELKPDVDERFYVQNDLKQRLLNSMPNCKLVDVPNWDCPSPDFFLEGKYNYTFATFVVKKNG